MLKRIYSLFIVVLFIYNGISFAQIINTVTFSANMSSLIAAGFDSAQDSIMVQGLVWGEGLSDNDLSGSRIMLPDPANPTIFKTTIVLTIPSSSGLTVGDSIRWKLMAWPSFLFENGGWESGFDASYDGYPFIIQPDGSIINLDPVVPKIQFKGETGSVGGPQNTLHIKLDLSSIYGSGLGYFDPAEGDFVRVEGFTWDDNSLVIGNDNTRFMHQNPLEPGIIYETTIVVELDTAKVIGDSLRWKFKGGPDTRFGNMGWEGSNGRYYVFREDSAEVELGPFTPYFFPLGPVLESEMTILFQVDMNNQPRNYYDNSLIPVDSIEFIGIRGDHDVFGGSVNGPFVPSDTLDGSMFAMNDSGIRGDKVAGDKIWSRAIKFPSGSQSGGFAYKYGAYYKGCELINGAKPMDNEGNLGQDHMGRLIQTASGIIEFLDVWSQYYNSTTDVRQIDEMIPNNFVLEQNYPNPFNPSTTIKYAISKPANVNLSIYNILGQKVMELVNTQQTAGTYEVRFNGASLSSGIYFYSLSNGSSLITKKMMLLK
ncbi:MAG: hypothetical protein A2315_07975 [Ignavibacteria bacterium RIFOXYB2_FULL_35_12]|nr:MAG: hypothetical protein A2058_13615 [Ignavibacteria bacterium GWA2_36_19]OGU51854.1 MAG: hypothetical protein A2006_15380 [Ignavibacteria bacterium GWC2_35_8]OGU61171.1 MAG: hypothetical protein A2X60_15240 [Ignavibacteria bacterium GWF2_35_20]OGU83542.1 MAG: hypothetical protein A2254_00540 [Ignavibacteria bacterium RIFOXYA2_FULL_35_9]OGU88707.1 MAG: hypothetical protein A3K31_06690 [Ignavibacteria bacterium RIFOXYA12_FULL_35_25]OGU89163.1 MAG: hypothetical protein A2492_00170 [Ignavibac